MGVAALRVVRAAGLADLVRPGSAHGLDELGSQRVLPVRPELRPLLPGGVLRRGATIGVDTAAGCAPAATSLLLALLSEASRAGSWCVVVGLPTLGAAAAAELGIALDRLALVPHPGPDWPTVVAALLDGFDIVVVGPGGAATGAETGAPTGGGAVSGAVSGAVGGIAPAVAARLAARARQRGAVLVPFRPWPGVDLVLDAADPQWHGVEPGRGRLRGRQLTVTARGRGAASAPRVTHLWLPAPASSPPVTPSEAEGADGAGLATVHELRRTG